MKGIDLTKWKDDRRTQAPEPDPKAEPGHPSELATQAQAEQEKAEPG